MVNPTGYTALDLVGFTDKGPYDPNVNYVRNDLSHDSGNIWRCLIDDTIGIRPTEGANWTIFISEPSNMVETSIAPIETSPATAAHTVGTQLYYNDTLYKVKAAIAVGDSLVVDTNIELADNITTQLAAKANTSDLGTAAAKDSTSAIAQGSTDLIESGAVYSALGDKANTADLGTAAAKDSTNAVTQSSTDLVESGAVYSELSSVKQALSDEVATRVELGAHNAVEPEVVHFMPVAASTGSDTTYTINVNVTCFVAKVKPNTDYVYNRSSGDRCLIMASPNYPAVDGACKVIINTPPSLPYTFNTGNNNYVVIYTNSTITTYDVIKPLLKLASDPSNEFTPFVMTNQQLMDELTIVDGTSSISVDTTKCTDGGCSIYKMGHLVQVDIALTAITTTGTWANIATLPYKPIKNVAIPLANSSYSNWTISDQGKIQRYAAANNESLYAHVVYFTND